MISKLFILFVTLCTGILFGCNNGHSGAPVTVKVDADKFRELDVVSDVVIEAIPLESTEESTLRKLSEFALVSDTLYVLGDGKMLRFNRAGLFIDAIGGNTGELFRDFDIRNDSLFLLGMDGTRLYGYLLSDIDDSPTVYETGGVSLSSFSAIKTSNKFLAAGVSAEPWLVAPVLYGFGDSVDFNDVVSEREDFANPLPEVFYSSQEGNLYWRMLCDTIYSVDDDLSRKPAWFIDFGDKRLPEELETGTDTYNRMIHLDMLNNRSRYATLVNNVREDDSYLYFIYLYGQGRQYVARYNKSRKESEQFLITDSNRAENLRISYMDHLNGDLLVSSVRPGVNNNNPVILRIRP